MTAPAAPSRCSFCDKRGLPILPVRYAVARSDLGHAPELAAPFGTGVDDIKLPTDVAHYTLRLLRPGFLYQFDELRKEWSAYVVNAQSYLFEFDVYAKSPPALNGKEVFSQACVDKGDPYIARCITVKDAPHATKVWLGVSDVMWTPAVLAQHASVAWRQAHMQCLDLAKWRSQSPQAHIDDFGALQSRVAEFSADGMNLRKETRAYLAHFLPPGKTPEFLLGPDVAGKQAMQQLAPCFQALVPDAVSDAAPAECANTAAWLFSPQAFSALSGEREGLTAWGARAAQPYRPVVMAVPDAVGIAMELNHLVLQRALEWTERWANRWPLTTASEIDGIRAAVEHGMVAQQGERQQDAAALLLPFVPAPLVRGQTTAALSDDLDAAGEVDPQQAQEIGQQAWGKYQDMYDETARDQFFTQYAQQFKTLQQNTIKPLDLAYLAWLQSSGFQAHFTHNFDPANAISGMAYQQTVQACIQEATGRTAVTDYFSQCLGHDPTQPGEVILRALVYNQDALAQQWNEAAGALKDPDVPWLDSGKKIYGGIKGILAKDPAYLDGAWSGLAKYLYQLSAPIMTRLNQAAADFATLAAAKLPEQRLMGLMQALVSAQSPGKVLVDVRGMQTRKQAARALSGALAQLSGEQAQQWRGSARAALDGMADGQTQGYPYRGLFLVDTEKLTQLRGTQGAARVAGALAATSDTEFETLLKGNARYLINNEVTAGGIGLLLTGFTLSHSYGDLMKAEGSEHTAKTASFAAGVSAMIGETGRLAGGILKKLPWGVAPFKNPIVIGPFRFVNLAELVTGIGKLLGAVGGVVAGVVQMYEGYRAAMVEGDIAFGVGIAFIGFVNGILAVAVFMNAIAPGLGLVIALLLVVAGYVVTHLKHDPLQHWLDRCYFGKHTLQAAFANQAMQDAAYAALLQGD